MAEVLSSQHTQYKKTNSDENELKELIEDVDKD